MEAEALWEHVPLYVRLFTAGSAATLCVCGLVNVAVPACYTTAVMGLCLLLFGVVVLLCEFSPYGLNVLMGLCPLLGEYFFRGILYLLVGLLPLGKEMSPIGRIAGACMLLSGAANIALHLLLPAALEYHHPEARSAAHTVRGGGDDDEDDHAPYAADECPPPSNYEGL